MPVGLASAVVAAGLEVRVATAQPVAYCGAIPTVNVAPQAWGFHAGQPITGARYAG